MADTRIDDFVKGLFVGALVLLFGYIVGVLTVYLNPPPVETIIVPYDGCSTDSECEGV